MLRKRCFYIMVTIFLLLSLNCGQKKYDLVILDGKVIAGDGNPWFKADIGIKGDKIIFIGEISPQMAKQSINARGLIVCPGFIDIHTHVDRGIDNIPTADNYLLQGVTTALGGNCGGHPFPLKNLFATIKRQGIAINFCSLVGHNTIRRQVMALKMDDPSKEEMKKMKNLLDQEMRAGGMGLSTGLAYMPGIYTKTEELVELASVVARYDGLYASHIRDQGDGISEVIEEAIEVGEENGIRVQISHVKLAKDTVWGKLAMITTPILRARDRGVEVTIDQYPYTATSSGFASSFPSWALEGGDEELKKRLQNPGLYQKILDGIIIRRLTSSKGIDKLSTIYVANYKKQLQFEGKNLAEILKMQGKALTVVNGARLIIDIQRNGGASAVFFQMDGKDVQKIMALDYTMIASDGGIVEKGRGVPHCRNYGTFPRVIRHYCLKKKIFSLEKAIQKMTSLPAQTLRLYKRGLVKEGLFADLVIFDSTSIRDTATYKKPHQYPEGIRFVLVNGIIAAKEGKSTGSLAGKIIYGPGK